MTTLTRWDPFRELEDVQNRLSSILGRSSRRTDNGQENMTLAEWTPLVDITEDEKDYIIKAELPEVAPADVKVTVEHGMLVITGERKLEKEEKGRKFHRVERSYGSFSRSFALPEDADPEKVSARFKDGLLRVHVAKSETARPKQIEVKTA